MEGSCSRLTLGQPVCFIPAVSRGSAISVHSRVSSSLSLHSFISSGGTREHQ